VYTRPKNNLILKFDLSAHNVLLILRNAGELETRSTTYHTIGKCFPKKKNTHTLNMWCDRRGCDATTTVHTFTSRQKENAAGEPTWAIKFVRPIIIAWMIAVRILSPLCVIGARSHGVMMCGTGWSWRIRGTSPALFVYTIQSILCTRYKYAQPN
jgi:hypothetical protein